MKQRGKKKTKRIKINEDNIRDLWDNIKWPNIQIIGVPEEEDKKKGHEKILEEIIVENFPKIRKEIVTQIQETQSPKQDKPKAKHPKTHINQINKDQTQIANFKSSKGKTANNTQGDPHKDNSWSFNRNSSGQKGMAGHTKSDERETTITQITVASKDLIQIWRGNQKLYRQGKAERIQHHQISSSTNAKGSSLDRKHRKVV